MKRSKGQNQGRPPQFGSRKVQTTVRIPERVLVILKNRHGVLQRAIDEMVIIPVLRQIEQAQKDAEEAGGGDAALFKAVERVRERRINTENDGAARDA